MNKSEIEKNLIFLFIRGSHAYGLNNDQSDIDIGGICLPSKNVIYGLDKFEQDDRWVDKNGEKEDKVIYNITKAVGLMCEANPNMLDFLYTPERVIKYVSPVWKKFMDIRDDFLSIKAKGSFQGYAMAQLNRIKTHRGYLLNPPKGEPKRADYDLPEKSVFPLTQLEVISKVSSEYVSEDKRDTFYSELNAMMDKEGAQIFKKYIAIEHYPFAIADFKKGQREFLNMISSLSGTFLKDEFTNMAENELRYMSSRYNWSRYKKWEKGRNKKRAVMEAESGFDRKHACHLIRLLLMSVEILSGKGVLVDRTGIDRDYLMDIRNGQYTFDEILEHCDELTKKGNALYKDTVLPENPNYDKINDLLADTLDEHLGLKSEMTTEQFMHHVKYNT